MHHDGGARNRGVLGRHKHNNSWPSSTTLPRPSRDVAALSRAVASRRSHRAKMFSFHEPQPRTSSPLRIPAVCHYTNSKFRQEQLHEPHHCEGHPQPTRVCANQIPPPPAANGLCPPMAAMGEEGEGGQGGGGDGGGSAR